MQVGPAPSYPFCGKHLREEIELKLFSHLTSLSLSQHKGEQ